MKNELDSIILAILEVARRWNCSPFDILDKAEEELYDMAEAGALGEFDLIDWSDRDED